MKKLAIILILGACSLNLSAQEENTQKEADNDEFKTLFNKKSSDKESNIEYGGYGAIALQYSRILDQDAFVFGGKGMLLINHHFGIGIGAHISFKSPEKRFEYDPENGIYNPNRPLDSEAEILGHLRMAYGGIYLEYIIAPNKPIHVSIPVLLGGGYAYYLNTDKIVKWFEDNNNNNGSYPENGPQDYTYSSDGYFIVQPGIDVEMNMSKFFRVSLGASYRFIGGLDLQQTEPDELDGFNGALTLKFGKY